MKVMGLEKGSVRCTLVQDSHLMRVNVCARAYSGVGWGMCRERRDHDVLIPRARACTHTHTHTTYTHTNIMGQVVSKVEEMSADQEFFSDITSLTMVSITSLVMRWPRHRQLISKLKGSKMSVIDYQAIRLLFPGWRGRSVFSFLNYYSKYDYMDALFEDEPSEQDTIVRLIVGQVEERISVMIGCGIPTAGERVLEMKRLEMLADKERDNKKVKKKKNKKKQSTIPLGATLVPIFKSGRADSGNVEVNILKRPC